MPVTTQRTFAADLQQPIQQAEDQIALQVNDAVDQLILLANGTTLPQPAPQQPRIYTALPDRLACQYLIDRILGLPGARLQIDHTRATQQVVIPTDEEIDKLSIEEMLELQKFFCQYQPELKPIIQVSQFETQISEAERKIAEIIPQLIETLFALANGITLEKQTKNGTRIVAKPPDRRATQYIINRILARPGNQINFQQPQPQIQIPSDEEMLTMQPQEMIDIYFAINNAPPAPEAPQPAKFPQVITAAEQKIIDFLPTAIVRLTELAKGVQLQQQTPEGPIQYTTPPDRIACQYLIDRILGPTKRVIAAIDPKHEQEQEQEQEAKRARDEYDQERQRHLDAEREAENEEEEL